VENRIDEFLQKGLEELQLIPNDECISSFLVYLTELKKWNKIYNLTGIRKDEDIVTKHFLDSLLYMKGIPQGDLKIADIGSGAGFPGIPIKIIRPELYMYLIESSVKKSLFLRHIISLLKMKHVDVIEDRVENIKKPFCVDVAVTRALFSVEEFIKRVSHLMKKGGILIHSKGPKVQEELRNLRDINYEIIPCTLPSTAMQRYLVIITSEDSL